MENLDVRELRRGLQVTFEVRSHTVIGEVRGYLGEGLYEVVDEDDNEHEMHITELIAEDED
jgi:hypothetical protein